MRRAGIAVALAVLVVLAVDDAARAASQKPPLTGKDVADIATLLKLEDTRQLDEPALKALLSSAHPEVKRRAVIAVGRIADPAGVALLAPLQNDPDPEIVASAAFALGQLHGAIPWLTTVLTDTATPPAVAFEAARALGKTRTPEAWAALAAYLTDTTPSDATAPVVGEALLSIGRYPEREDIAAVVKWATSSNTEVRWRAAWALFRPRNPDAVPHLLTLSRDSSPEVRYWAVRGLAMPVAGTADAPGVDRTATAARLREAVQDSDRRVRTEAVRALGGYDDDASFAVVLAALEDPDTWLSVSAAEILGGLRDRREAIEPRLKAATDASRPEALRTVAGQALARLTAEPAAGRGGGRAGRAGRGGGGRQGGGAGRPAVEPAPARTDADYRAIVERWIVPAYNGAPEPRAVWNTPKGEIEMTLHADVAPLGMEEFVRLTESGDIVGTAFTRVVPNFVAQQATIRGANRLRDEVSRLGLTRGNLSWASAGLDTGRPGYTLGSTPQPHNEGDFTALGSVIRGMDVVDRLELGDTVTAARMVK